MRGFKWQAEYKRTPFKPFKCQECGELVQICGKTIYHQPTRWITRGICKTTECRVRGEMIVTHIEPAVSE